MKRSARPAAPAVRTFLYVYEGGYLTCRRRLAGIYRVTRPLGVRIERMDVRYDSDLEEALDFLKPDGVIVEGDALAADGLEQVLGRGIPAVLCDPQPVGLFSGRCHRVLHDSRDTARHAIRELLSLGYASYGCVEYWVAYDWSNLRVNEFEKAVRAKSVGGRVFRSSVECRKGDLGEFVRRVSDFLVSLPKPCGIFAVNDEMALNVLSAALMAGYDVPGEVSVVGIDNDELLCDNAPVSLSSVAPDFEKSGRLAAEQLLKEIESPGLPRVTHVYGAAPLVRRKSTAVFKVRMEGVTEALDAVRTRHAESGFGVDDVVAAMRCSRRSAETRFFESTGETIGSAIRRHRIESAEALLRDTDLGVADIAARCGFASGGTFQKAFVRCHGTSPSAWRAARRG